MDQLFNLFYVHDDVMQSFFRLILFVLVLDFSMGFAQAIKAIKSSVS